MRKLKLVKVVNEEWEVLTETGTCICNICDGIEEYIGSLDNGATLSDIREVLRLWDEMKRAKET